MSSYSQFLSLYTNHLSNNLNELIKCKEELGVTEKINIIYWTDRENLPSKAKRGQYKDHEKEKDECFPHDGMVEFSTGPMELKVVAGVDHQ